MSHWFRLYSDLLNDPKCQSLGGAAFKTWVNLLCIATENEGKIDEKSLPFKLRMKSREVRAHIATLKSVGLLDVVENTLKPHNWEDRQWISDDSKERVRRYRERQKKKRDGNGHVTVTVTAQDTDTDTESPLPNGKGKNGAHSEPAGSGAVAPLEIISVPKVDADTSAYFKRGRQILENRADAGRLLAAILKNNNGNLNAARLAMERVACAVSPLDYANRLANGSRKRDDDEEARREKGDCF